jgi:hypothetical protein
VKKAAWRIAAIAMAFGASSAWGATGNPATENPPDKPAEALYMQLGHVGLDAARVYHVRGASLNRSGVEISLDDGTIGFTSDVLGKVTGAFFEGDGEILLTPPSAMERNSMSLFTGMAILEERFETGYFRFNDDAPGELAPDLRAMEEKDKNDFVERWQSTARDLASADAMRLLLSFSRFLPVDNSRTSEAPSDSGPSKDRFFHGRLEGTNLGVFDVYFDSTAVEQIQAGQAKTAEDGETYYNVWTSFSPASGSGRARANEDAALPTSTEMTHENQIAIRSYSITTEVLPPTQIHATATLQCDVRVGGERALLFELSRFLKIERVELDGKPVEFIHNPALEGSHLSRQGNDVVAVILPAPAKTGEKMALTFVYGGEVLAEAGSGLLYVGARGTWYPNRGMEMADFDLEFSYPQGWTLVATGKPSEVVPGRDTKGSGEQSSRWVSERAIPLAGFNLGKYREVTTRAENVTVETYAVQGVEREFPSAPIQVIGPVSPDADKRPPQTIVPARPSAAETEGSVGETAARAIEYFADRFGPFPYSHLALTQIPGRESQGWPGLIYLSSYAFLTDEERQELHYEPYRILLQESVPVHETAHQWWGDLVMWDSYRDQWFSEGLANYCSMMMIQEKNPSGFREVMEKYRQDLLEKNKDGLPAMEAGPVTLGHRLQSSRFPGGYEAISYGRGTWLFHMLRTMLDDAAAGEGGRGVAGADEPFMRGLRKVRERYAGQAISTRQLLDVFAEDIPPSLRYEGKKSLDWFLDGWINGTALPKLELKSVRFTPRGKGSVVSGTILQKQAPEDLVTSVPVYEVITGRQPVLLGRVFADGEESSFRLPAPAGAHKIVLDPYDTILTSPK